MHIYDKIHVLLSTLYYMFRRLLLRLQGELYLMLKTTFTLSTDLKFYYTWFYKSIYSYLKSHIWFNVRLKMVQLLV